MGATTPEVAPTRSPPFPDEGPTELDGGAFASGQQTEEVPSDDATDLSVCREPARIEVSCKASEAEAADGIAPKAAGSPPLPSSWLSTQKSKREVPGAAKAGAIGVALLLLLVFVAPNACGSQSQTTKSSMIAEGDVEDGEHLKKRRHVTDEDFRVRGSSPVVAEAPLADSPAIDLEERKRQRGDNPEDIRGARKAHMGRRSRRPAPPVPAKLLAEDESIFIFNTSLDGATVPSSQGTSERVLLSAASMVRISLSHDVVLRRGRTTVIAVVGKQQSLPAGTKLIGQASASVDGVVSIRFDTIVLPNGASVKARAEALDASTDSPDLLASVAGGAAPRMEASVARSVGASTADRLATGVLGSGIVGGAARQTLSESGRSRSVTQRSARVVTLSGDTPLKALFLREVLIGAD